MARQEITKEKSYLLKIPVYTSEFIDRPKDLFGGISYSDMISYIIKKIEVYKQQPYQISKDKRNKALTKEIDKIKYSQVTVGTVPSILFQISAYNTNLHDGYVEIKERYVLQQNHKIGSETNFFLLYPHIVGIDANNYKHHWLILIYEDPNKEANEIINTVKLILNKVLDIKVANIKLPELLSELRKYRVAPELQVKLSSLIYDDNDVDIKYREYLLCTKFKKSKEDTYKNIPFNSINEILCDSVTDSEYNKKEVKIIRDGKEYRFTREYKEAQEKMIENIEEIFNFPIVVPERDLPNLFLPEIIIANFNIVLEKYLSEPDVEN